jgi:GMP synthase-like glutamine amidotransferase
MGGPMSVNDEALYPWLKAEKRLIAEALTAGRPVVGVCLGAQMLAAVAGARVYKNAVKEIGWHEIEWLDGSVPRHQTVFQWHGETFDLPAGSTQLARSAACEAQAFRLGRALALQFHLEITPEIIERLLVECAADIGTGPCEQTSGAIRAGLWRVEQLRPLLYRWMDSSATCSMTA